MKSAIRLQWPVPHCIPYKRQYQGHFLGRYIENGRKSERVSAAMDDAEADPPQIVFCTVCAVGFVSIFNLATYEQAGALCTYDPAVGCVGQGRHTLDQLETAIPDVLAQFRADGVQYGNGDIQRAWICRHCIAV
jgi:hypothetical protein